MLITRRKCHGNTGCRYEYYCGKSGFRGAVKWSAPRLRRIYHRMGIPYRQKKINILSVALDAPQDTISALAGKLGNLKGVSVKTAYSHVTGQENEA